MTTNHSHPTQSKLVHFIPHESTSALSNLLESAKAFASDAKAPATRRAYRRDWEQFTTWCDSCSVTSLPADPTVITSYVAHLAEQGRKPSSIDRALVAISQAHKMAGYDSTTSNAAVRETLKGYKRQVGTAPKQKAPLTVDHLKRMLESLPVSLIGSRDRALLLLGFAGGFRRSEIVGLDVDDIEFVSKGMVVTLRRSKTDQEGEGRIIGIPFGSSEETCPVRALRAWLEQSGIITGPLFRAVDRHGNIAPRRLTDRTVARVIKRIAAKAGYDATDFSGHSLRAGLATSAAEAGKSERVIMATTGHRSEKMVRKYIREGSLFRDCASEGLL